MENVVYSLSHLKIYDARFRTNKRNYFFTQNIVKLLSCFPKDILSARSLCVFKRRFGHIIKEKKDLRSIK